LANYNAARFWAVSSIVDRTGSVVGGKQAHARRATSRRKPNEDSNESQDGQTENNFTHNQQR
jgi:hypothetical protein